MMYFGIGISLREHYDCLYKDMRNLRTGVNDNRREKSEIHRSLQIFVEPGDHSHQHVLLIGGLAKAVTFVGVDYHFGFHA
jgi:hypothetical protein